MRTVRGKGERRPTWGVGGTESFGKQRDSLALGGGVGFGEGYMVGLIDAYSRGFWKGDIRSAVHFPV